MIKLAIITTHPIQYNAPLFKLLAQQKGIEVKVFFTWGAAVLETKFDPGFGKQVTWDIPLLEGYQYDFIENIADDPGSHHHKGIDNPLIIHEIEKYHPAAILVFGWNFKSHLRVLRYYKNKIPIFFRGDSTLLNERQGLRMLARRLYLKWVYTFIDYALYVGENNKQYYLKHGLKAHQLIHTAHTIDIERFKEPNELYEERAAEWKKKLGIKPEEITLLYAGKIEPVKNPSFLLDVANGLKNEPVKIIIVGNGPLEKKIKEQAAENGNIIFLDFQNQSVMPIVYRLGDVFILCSVSETWGLGANEAMACGCALALSNKVGSAPDVVTVNNGIVFNVKKPEECVAFLKNCSADRTKLTAMKGASKILSEKFSFNQIIQPFLGKLNELNNTLNKG